MKRRDMSAREVQLNYHSFRYNNLKQSAKRRGIMVTLTREQHKRIECQDCYYCGAIALPYNGIDRYDNSRGYLPDNCVACCWKCNRSKGVDSAQDFIQHCRSVVEYQNKVERNIPF